MITGMKNPPQHRFNEKRSQKKEENESIVVAEVNKCVVAAVQE
jgi:hypothetical protein